MFVIFTTAKSQTPLRVAFYNTENFFDIKNNPITHDDDFTPTGKKRWGKKKFNNKLTNLYKTIAAMGNPYPPFIIGLCEVENSNVLYSLTKLTPLKQYGYKFIHSESADPRGIDCALLYTDSLLHLLLNRDWDISIDADTSFKTRSILYAKFTYLPINDTLEVIVNHWPSRVRGIAESNFLRNSVAKILKHKTDSILKLNPQAKIIIMGDFNDEPKNNSLYNVLQAKSMLEINNTRLINLALSYKGSIGTIKYKGNWQIFDQIIVSKALLKPKRKLTVKNLGFQIFNVPFLLTYDEKEFGQMPYKTYNGQKYLGGFSDHLPVFVELH